MVSDNVRSLNTIGKLQSVIGSISQPTVIVGGYWVIGDGGGGMFHWDESSSSGDNGTTPGQPGTIIVPTGSTSARWVRIYSGAIDVKWFGAHGQEGLTLTTHRQLTKPFQWRVLRGAQYSFQEEYTG